MADLTTVIGRVRRLVNDYAGGPPVFVGALYANDVYEEQIEFALQKLSYDFADTYTIANIPYDREFLLVKLATINMCYIRANEVEAVLTDPDFDGGITSISVPDLSVSDALSAKDVYAQFMDLAERLQEEYDGELEGRKANAPSSGVVVGIQTRERKYPWGPRRGTFNQVQRVPRQAVSNPPIVKNLLVEVASPKATFYWDAWRNTDFSRYELWSHTVSGFTRDTPTSVREAQVGGSPFDNRVTITPSPGVRYYLVYAVSINGLFSPASIEIQATV